MSTNAARGRHTAAPRIVLLVNPNTNQDTTTMMAGLAAAELADTDLHVVGITAALGPRMLITPDALRASAEHVCRAVREFLDGPSGGRVAAVVVAAIGDPGRAELAASLAVPVVGIGQASILAASVNGRPFAMATSTPLLADSLAELVHAAGRSAGFLGISLTESGPLELAADPEAQFHELRAAVMRAANDGAKAVIIAGGPLSEAARRLALEGPAEIIEPIPSACQLVCSRLTADSEAPNAKRQRASHNVASPAAW